MLSRTLITSLLLLGASSAVTAFADDHTTVVNQQSIADPGTEWLSYGRDYTEQRF